MTRLTVAALQLAFTDDTVANIRAVSDRDGSYRSHVPLPEASQRLLRVPVKFELAGDEVIPAEPENDALVADVFAMRFELDHAGLCTVDPIFAAEMRARVGFGPGPHLLDQVEVVVAEIAAHEALVPRTRRDLPYALELGKVEPLLGRPPLMRVREKTRSFDLSGREKEQNRLLLVVQIASIAYLEFPRSLAALTVYDAHRHVLVARFPVADRVLESFAPIKDLPGGLATVSGYHRCRGGSRRHDGGHGGCAGHHGRSGYAA